MKCKFILNDTLNSVKVLFRHLVASLTDGHLVIRSCFHCVAQVFYLSDTEAQFDNLKLETVPMDQEKLPQKLSVLFFVLFFTAFLILDIQTEFYFNTPPSTAWNLPKYNPLWLTEFIWMLTHPTPSSNSHTAFIFLQLKTFACVCVCVWSGLNVVLHYLNDMYIIQILCYLGWRHKKRWRKQRQWSTWFISNLVDFHQTSSIFVKLETGTKIVANHPIILCQFDLNH